MLHECQHSGICSINEAKALVILLMARAAKSIGLAVIGLKLGYYTLECQIELLLE